MLKTVITIKLGLDNDMNLGSKECAITISPGIGISTNQKMVGFAELISMFVQLQKRHFKGKNIDQKRLNV